ncbi:MAG TPA: HipA domain-containing protein [bacterium]|nr:HipA domain-containing protein [bacterium]
MNKCLICRRPLEAGDYHPACAKRFFGVSTPPELAYGPDEVAALAKQVVQSSVTVTGVQPKLSLHIEKSGPKKRRFTIVGLWGAFILKPPFTRYPFLPEIEDATMHLADAAGIATVPHALIRMRGGDLAYITRRIDRDGERRIHMEDMCQLSGRLTEDKYQGSYEQIGRIVKEHAANTGFDLTRFAEVVIFSLLTGNADMHLKNFSLRYDGGIAALSPTYDLVATKLVLPEDPEETALTLNGKKRRLTARDMRLFCGALGLNEKQTRSLFLRMLAAAERFPTLLETSFLPEPLRQTFIALIAERKTRLLTDQ